jgi:hypothetical protein
VLRATWLLLSRVGFGELRTGQGAAVSTMDMAFWLEQVDDPRAA